MRRLKDLNVFILISSFAKALIEVFVPIILYKDGYEINGIFYYFMLKSFFVFLLNPVLCIFSNKIGFKWINIISSLFFFISYFLLFNLSNSYLNLSILAIVFTLYEHLYWISRHYHSLCIFPKGNIATLLGKIIILSQAALIPASYIGALLIDNFDINTVLILITLLLLFSSLFIFKIDIRTSENNNVLNDVTSLLKTIPIRNIIFWMLEQFRIIGSLFFGLYIYIYVDNNIEYVGILNLIVGISSMIFIHFFSKKIVDTKKDYIFVSSFLVAFIYFIKLNVLNLYFLLFISILQGLADRMYELVTGNNVYSYGKDYNKISYIIVIESLFNISRVLVCFIGLMFSFNIKSFLYLCTFVIVISGIVGFKDKKLHHMH